MPLIAYLSNPNAALVVLTEEEVQDLAKHDKILDFEDDFDGGEPTKRKMVIAFLEKHVHRGRLNPTMRKAAEYAVLFLIADNTLKIARETIATTAIPYPGMNFHLALRVVKDEPELQAFAAEHTDGFTIIDDETGGMPFHYN